MVQAEALVLVANLVVAIRAALQETLDIHPVEALEASLIQFACRPCRAANAT